MSQSELARLIGVPRNTVSEWETGYIGVFTPYIPKLAEALRMDVWILLTGKPKKEALRRENLISLLVPWELIKRGEKRIIGKRIELARLAKGYTQEKLAQELKTHNSTLSYYEKGIFSPSEKIISRLAEILEISPSLLKLKNEK
jgi:transcriptional regulator with XRE-family HTH domain